MDKDFAELSQDTEYNPGKDWHEALNATAELRKVEAELEINITARVEKGENGSDSHG